MATFYDVVKNYLSPYYWYVLITVMFILFGFLSKYAYDKYYAASYQGENNDFNDVANAEMREKDANIYFFYADWCPHCKNALPDWIKFKNQYDNKTVNGYVVKCIDMNCSKETPEIDEAINEFGISGYPTVKMKKDNKIIEFDAKISYNTLEQFVQMMTNQ